MNYTKYATLHFGKEGWYINQDKCNLIDYPIGYYYNADEEIL